MDSLLKIEGAVSKNFFSRTNNGLGSLLLSGTIAEHVENNKSSSHHVKGQSLLPQRFASLSPSTPLLPQCRITTYTCV
jgi:hypothetical protein